MPSSRIRSLDLAVYDFRFRFDPCNHFSHTLAYCWKMTTWPVIWNHLILAEETTMPRTASPKKKKQLYSVHPGVAMVHDWIAKLPEKTGRSMQEWIDLVQKSGPADEKQRRE